MSYIEERAVVMCNAALAVVAPGPDELDTALGLIERAPDATIGAEPQLVRARAKELVRAVLEQCNAERDQPRGVWWLSFVGSAGFLGGAFVRADDLREALTRAHLLGINPGGEVNGYALTSQAVAELPSEFIEKLMSKAEIAAFDATMAARKGKT